MMRATSHSARWKAGRIEVKPTTGCSRKPLTGMCSGVRRPSTSTTPRIDADLFLRFAKRRGLDGLARLDAAAGQRHLSGVIAKAGTANRQRQMQRVVMRLARRSFREGGIDQQQRRAVVRAVGQLQRIPADSRRRRHAQLRLEAG